MIFLWIFGKSETRDKQLKKELFEGESYTKKDQEERSGRKIKKESNRRNKETDRRT